MSSASAGWFDDDMDNHDFGNFTMDVPSDTDLTEMIWFNHKDAMEKATKENDGVIPVTMDEFKGDVKDVHPSWSGDDFTVDYVDCKEDEMESHSVMMSQLYKDSSFVEDSGDLHVYNLNLDDEEYGVCKCNGGKEIVLVVGSDLEFIKKMASSVEFK